MGVPVPALRKRGKARRGETGKPRRSIRKASPRWSDRWPEVPRARRAAGVGLRRGTVCVCVLRSCLPVGASGCLRGPKRREETGRQAGRQAGRLLGSALPRGVCPEEPVLGEPPPSAPLDPVGALRAPVARWLLCGAPGRKSRSPSAPKHPAVGTRVAPAGTSPALPHFCTLLGFARDVWRRHLTGGVGGGGGVLCWGPVERSSCWKRSTAKGHNSKSCLAA